MEGMRVNAAEMYAASKSLSEAYAAVMAPLARETGLAGTAVDILLFLANNPGEGHGEGHLHHARAQAGNRVIPRREPRARGLPRAAGCAGRPEKERADAD